jgi:hypothetical protein
MGEDVTVCLTPLAPVNVVADLAISDYIQSMELRYAVHSILSEKEQRIKYASILRSYRNMD